MSQPEAVFVPGEDQPIIVGGGARHITVQVRDPSSRRHPRILSATPRNPAVPFKELVITNGVNEVFRWQLSEEWKITIA